MHGRLRAAPRLPNRKAPEPHSNQSWKNRTYDFAKRRIVEKKHRGLCKLAASQPLKGLASQDKGHPLRIVKARLQYLKSVYHQSGERIRTVLVNQLAERRHSSGSLFESA